jgi:hypothetical protein
MGQTSRSRIATSRHEWSFGFVLSKGRSWHVERRFKVTITPVIDECSLRRPILRPFLLRAREPYKPLQSATM